MVRDAEEHAESDKAFQLLATARNQADNLIHATEKTLKDAKEGMVSEDEKTAIEEAIGALKEAIKGDDKEAIDEKSEALTSASAGLAEKLHAAAQAESGEEASDDAPTSGDDSAVDAEFEELEDDDENKGKDKDK